MKKKLIKTFIFVFFTKISFSQGYTGDFLNYQFDSTYLKQLSDTSYNPGSLMFRATYLNSSISKGNKNFILLPVDLKMRFGNHFLLSQNDENFVPNSGNQVLLNAGILYKNNLVECKFSPRLLINSSPRLSNSNFPTQYSKRIWYWYYDEINRIDRPFSFDAKSISTFFGDSYLKIRIKNLNFGFSTTTQWIGSGYFNSLVSTNTAPGIPHFFLKSAKPLKIPGFKFEFLLYGGLMSNSNINFPLKSVDSLQYLNRSTNLNWNRYVNGISIILNPSFTKNLFFGFTRLFYLNKSDLSSVKSYLPVFIFGRNPLDPVTVLDRKDQLIVLNFRYIFDKSKFEIYGEFGRNDFSANLRDFILNPDHSAGYIFGFKKLVESKKNRHILFIIEYSNLQNSIISTLVNRDRDGWYRHSQISGGYTNFGQVVGAGIGTGSKALNTDIIFFNTKNIITSRFGLNYIQNNNDFLNNTFNGLSNLKPWIGYSGYYKRNFTIGKNIGISIVGGFLFQQNLFWYDQAKAELTEPIGYNLKSQLTPHFGLNYEYKL